MEISFYLDPRGDCTVVVPTTGHDEQVRFALTKGRDRLLVADGPDRLWYDVPESMRGRIHSAFVMIIDENESMIEERDLKLFVDAPTFL